jgi:hypothetical protein
MYGYPIFDLLAALPVILAFGAIDSFLDGLRERRQCKKKRIEDRQFELRIGMPRPVWDATWNLYQKLKAESDPPSYMNNFSRALALEDLKRICAVHKIDQRKAICLFLDELKRDAAKSSKTPARACQ